MLAAIKMFLRLLSIMYGIFDLVNWLFHFASKRMSMGVCKGLTGQ